jgi:hypothetical protein
VQVLEEAGDKIEDATDRKQLCRSLIPLASYLALSNNVGMRIRQGARALGRLGGLARARNLSRNRRKEIASLGGRAKALSRVAARRIRDNFSYLEAVERLRGTHGG